MLVGLAAVHPHGGGILRVGGGFRGVGAASSWNIEDLGQLTIAPHTGGENATRSLAMTEDGGSGTVPEEDAGVPVGPVDDA